MSDILLAKPKLPADWIDVSVGEPHIVRDILLKVFDISVWELPQEPHMYEYPDPKGYKPLIQLLEQKHKAPVIITNGAKQGLGACFYALRAMGKEHVAMKSPYWALIPPLTRMHGLEPTFSEPNVESEDPYLLLCPNNPDGSVASAEQLKEWSGQYKDANVPLIHDAAYYTRSYMPMGHSLPAVGDVQVYSISKMLGLSGLRIGYVVCPNVEFYKLIQQYMEAMTVGVSIVSQMMAHHILHRMNGYPTLTESFENQSAMALDESKKIIQKVSPEILEVNSNLGMFGWYKVGPKADFAKSKINFIDGALFGVPGMIRMNLAFPADKMEEIVTRLNSVLEG